MVTRLGLRQYGTVNAGLGWVGIGLCLLAGVQRALVNDPLWAGMAVAVVAVVLVPPILSGRPTQMIAWEVVALAVVPVMARSVGVVVGPAAYVAVAALALVVGVELDAFTPIEMPPRFAVAFVVVVTMAVAGLWAIVRFIADRTLGTSLLVDQAMLMWDLILASGIGVVAGIVFELYVRRVSPGHRRVGGP